MTIDEAIIKHIQKADSYHKAMPNYGEAADHRQLAEWLTELKEAKRLLKLAVTCLNDGGCTKDCDVCTNLEDCIRKRHDNSFKWRYTDEVKELIND